MHKIRNRSALLIPDIASIQFVYQLMILSVDDHFVEVSPTGIRKTLQDWILAATTAVSLDAPVTPFLVFSCWKHDDASIYLQMASSDAMGDALLFLGRLIDREGNRSSLHVR